MRARRPKLSERRSVRPPSCTMAARTAPGSSSRSAQQFTNENTCVASSDANHPHTSRFARHCGEGDATVATSTNACHKTATTKRRSGHDPVRGGTYVSVGSKPKSGMASFFCPPLRNAAACTRNPGTAKSRALAGATAATAPLGILPERH